MRRNTKYICKRCGYVWDGYVETKYCPRCYSKDVEILKKENKILKRLKEIHKYFKIYKKEIKEKWESEEKYIIKEYMEKTIGALLLLSLFIFIIYLLFNLLSSS